MSLDDLTFVERYGPWALVAGASEGVGAEYARAMAQRGLNVVLLARRQDELDTLAAAVRAETGVETRAVTVDLAGTDAMTKILDATAGVEIGMMMYCAGADPNYASFLANPVEIPLALVHRNCLVPMQMCHQFAGPMAIRGRGAIVLVSSAAGLAGAPNMVAYGASKAFDMVMAEALWAELHDSGVDVLSLVLGVTDTPALRRLLTRRGALADPRDPIPIEGVSTGAEVVREAIANLSNGPTWLVGDHLRESSKLLRALTRNEAVMAMIQQSGGAMAARPDAQVSA
ncbi:SDR family NAD(P)-dependent oxidoreductase [Frankia sp. AgB1.9]|uniref:SDR family NAD(P)-dependent oxidoreductase n=1 Tax=unclassified Frankia TaxID=2632575 RepID=UPI0019349025|nr:MULTISPECIES: SDR family NAD(P)-dependent oxidoreductase [unclassified Frankia]MBL7487242.1 SDR family NAD(P)-dependent oxidoreductase [Frankia sp. AgW1.1]MBL7547988.1 SDR family NAD(P)-dependent oxidoreductase [Frankia sp. AgB1.9]MBL7625019.1 SDR family NAD(P)-dependent oxidoreductase [Frankia sp. AgB1.8]